MPYSDFVGIRKHISRNPSDAKTHYLMAYNIAVAMNTWRDKKHKPIKPEDIAWWILSDKQLEEIQNQKNLEKIKQRRALVMAGTEGEV